MKILYSEKIFDYKTLRLIMGLIAFFLPIFITKFFTSPLSSISASYYSDTRDILVGMLFIVGALLFAYNGNTQEKRNEPLAIKIAAIAALLVALFPTTCDSCDDNFISTIHYIAAVILFGILAYFCLGPFKNAARRKGNKKAELRRKIYIWCGYVMIACMAIIFISKVSLPAEIFNNLPITYWGETIALFAFGFSWFVAARIIFVDKNDAHKLLEFKSSK